MDGRLHQVSQAKADAFIGAGMAYNVVDVFKPLQDERHRVGGQTLADPRFLRAQGKPVVPIRSPVKFILDTRPPTKVPSSEPTDEEDRAAGLFGSAGVSPPRPAPMKPKPRVPVPIKSLAYLDAEAETKVPITDLGVLRRIQPGQANLLGGVYDAAIEVDKKANEMLGGSGKETISARVGRDFAYGRQPGKTIARGLDFFAPGHTQAAFEGSCLTCGPGALPLTEDLTRLIYRSCLDRR